MAYPWIFESNFERGTNGDWDTESDTGALLDFPHASTLANINGIGPAAPYRGAFCMRVQMGDTNDHTVEEGDIDIAAAATAWFRFYLYVGNDVAATADDTFNIFELQAAANVVEACIGLRITAATDEVEIGIGETAPTAFATAKLVKGRWYAIELKVVLDDGAGNNGTLELFVDGSSRATVASLDQGAIVEGLLGTQDTLASTTGTLLFDQFIMDDARIFPIVNRYPTEVLLTRSGHVFVGPGVIENVSLLSEGVATNVLSVYDTSRGNTSDAFKVGVELKNVTAEDIVDPAGMPAQFTRGCYVQLKSSETSEYDATRANNPRAVVKIRWAPAYGSPGAVRTVASRLKVNPLEVL